MINFIIIVISIPFVYFTQMIIFFLLYKKESDKYDKYTSLIDKQHTILSPSKVEEYTKIRHEKINHLLKVKSNDLGYFYKIYKEYKKSNKWIEDNLYEVDYFKLKNREKTLKKMESWINF
tara:strand:- start:3029 stop:3388 length:360 start_codon:yes stop_codon:yes gene_type:complete